MRVTVEAFPQIDAIGYDCKLKYPVTVQVRPPKASGTPPTPVDFVAVLDTSAGMTKEMLQHLKEAMLGVVDAHLIGPEDRFCMVSWNSESEVRQNTPSSWSRIRSRLIGMLILLESCICIFL
jgi:hypothetical protein